ncbi:MAG TPA: TonB-dependent receptor [Blastocatellia bacterium]|nr:TonB-dependent receptor [Blastocatellia bacterium]
MAPIFVWGQDTTATATLTGHVQDARGAAILGAQVNLRNLATNQTRRVGSEADGSYRVAALPVGEYEVRVEARGFATYVNPIVTLVLGQTAALEITLQTGEMSAEVTVTEKPPALDPSSTASSTSIDPERIAELPVNSRNYLEFTLLAPGVAPSGGQATVGGIGSTGSPLADSGFTFGGLRPRSNAISIDGLDNTDATTGAARVALSPEIVREFQIVNSGSSAEVGGAAGGAINVLTRTGSNDFHGGGLLFLQHEGLNAHGPLLTSADATPQFRRSQFGGSLGGPIKRDRLFFYAALEGEHFSGENESEIDPLTLSRVNAALNSGIAPRSFVRSLVSNLFPTGQDETEAAGKLTYLRNSRHTLNLRFAFSNDRVRGDAFNSDALSDRSSRGSSYTKDYQLTGSAVTLLSDRLINDFRFQAGARRVVTRASSAEGPGVEIAGGARFGRPYDADAGRRETRGQLVESIALTRPHSEWKAGATVNDVSLTSDVQGGFSGLYVFSSLDDFVAGRPAVWRQAFGEPRTWLGVTSFGAFIQNQWRAMSRLTFNLGARFDAERLPAFFRTDTNNISPRLGLAWNPLTEWVVRAGFGLFYDRLPLAFLTRAIQKDGAQAYEQVATGQDAAGVFARSGGGRLTAPFPGITPSVFRVDPNFVTPYSAQANVGVERLLATNLTARAEYLFTRGIHLPRTRNINLLPPVKLTPANAALLGVTTPTAQQIGRLVFSRQRVDPRFDSVYQLEDSANSTYNGITLSLNQRLSHNVQFLAAYTYSKTIDTASDFDEQPENPYDLRAERALSRNHVGQRLVFNGIFELLGDEDEGGKGSSKKKGALNKLFSNIELAPIITLSSGRPANPLTGADENQGQAFPLTARPLGRPRNSLQTPRYINVDLRIVKYFPLGGLTPYSASGHRRADLVVEFFNLFNRPNVVGINPFHGAGSTPLPGFGNPLIFGKPRQVRLSIDFEF